MGNTPNPMGTQAPESVHLPEESVLVYNTRLGFSGLEPPKYDIPFVCTPGEYTTIRGIAAPLGDVVCLKLELCGGPVCASPFATGGDVLPRLERAFPRLSFDVECLWIDGDFGSHWAHVLTIRPTEATAEVVDAFDAQIIDDQPTATP